MPRVLAILGAIAALMLWPMLGFADGYTATVPIVNGDVHQSRQEALKLIFLEAGQTGAVSVSTRSMLLNGELSDAVRFDARYRLKRFQIRQEKLEDGYLTVSALLEAFPEEQEACTPSIAFPRFKYQWVPPENAMDPEGEILFRLALQKALDATESALIFKTQSRADSAYTLQFKLLGSGSFFESDVSLEVSAVGQGGHLLEQWVFPYSGSGLTVLQRQSVGSGVLRAKVLNEDVREFLTYSLTSLQAKLVCLPAVLPVTLSQGQAKTLEFLGPLATKPEPTVFFARTWPIQAGGAIDLHKIDAVLTPRVDGKKMTLEPLSGPEGQRSQLHPAGAALSGFLIIY